MWKFPHQARHIWCLDLSVKTFMGYFRIFSNFLCFYSDVFMCKSKMRVKTGWLICKSMMPFGISNTWTDGDDEIDNQTRLMCNVPMQAWLHITRIFSQDWKCSLFYRQYAEMSISFSPTLGLTFIFLLRALSGAAFCFNRGDHLGSLSLM